MVTVHALKGIVRYLGPTKDTFVQIGMRYQTLMIVGAAIYLLRHPLRGTSDRESANQATTTAAFGFVLLNLAVVLGFVIVLYDVFDWRDYRVVAPHLLLALLVLVGCDVRGWMGGYATVGVLLAALVIRQRFRSRVSLGDGGDAAMNRMSRVFGNFAEYAALVLVLLALLEINGGSRLLVRRLMDDGQGLDGGA